ncbi:hypothetical protein B0H14DRAFT_3490307 [Mycena olivaceomarginata]|nr:hypothetical protein B0H14DRAFT_3490307 [Mycena olivaceomarginata]
MSHAALVPVPCVLAIPLVTAAPPALALLAVPLVTAVPPPLALLAVLLVAPTLLLLALLAFLPFFPLHYHRRCVCQAPIIPQTKFACPLCPTKQADASNGN